MRNAKRFISMLLLLCMLLSSVPVAVNADGATQSGASATPVTVVYDFMLEKTTLTNTAGDSFAGKFIDGSANQGAVAAY